MMIFFIIYFAIVRIYTIYNEFNFQVKRMCLCENIQAFCKDFNSPPLRVVVDGVARDFLTMRIVL